MSVIIRLQNLPWSANALDIRTFFKGLAIPEGGVHIVGGDMGDAFIAFSTDEDARQAMMHDGGKIKDCLVKLLLSSRAEMQKVIELARQQAMSFMQIPPQPPIITSLSSILSKSLKDTDDKAISLLNDDLKDGGKDSDRRGERRSSKDSDRRKDRDRSRSRSRDRRRDRSRSRDRDRTRRRRDRSRSRDRRDSRRRDRRDKSRDKSREKSRERSRDKDRDRERDRERDRDRDSRRPRDVNKKEDDKNKTSITSPTSPPNKNSGNVWDIPLQALPGSVQNMPLQGMNVGQKPPLIPGGPRVLNQMQRMPNNAAFGTDTNRWMGGTGNRFDNTNGISNNNSNFNLANTDHLSRLHNLEGRRNPNAFQSTIPMNSMQQQQRGGMQESVKNIGQGNCVQINNVHPTTGYSDIRRFFSNLYIPNNGIKMINDNNGKKTGTVYIRFAKGEHRMPALGLSGYKIRDNRVEILPLEESAYINAVDCFRPNADRHSMDSGSETEGELQIVDLDVIQPNDNGHDPPKIDMTVLKLEDLPPFAKEHDVMKMFSDYSLMCILMVVTKEIRKQYWAYVQFHRPSDALSALNDKTRHILAHKVVKVFPCSLDAFLKAKAEYGGIDDIRPLQDASAKNNSPLKDPRQRRFDMTNNNSIGLPNNHLQPLMALPPPQDMRMQAENYPNQMSGGYQDQSRDVNNYMGRGGLSKSGFMRGERTNWVLLSGLPFKVSDRDVMDFFSDIGLNPNRVHFPLNQFGQSSGECFCEFPTPEAAFKACTKNGMPFGMASVSVKLIPKNQVDEVLGIHEPPNQIQQPIMNRNSGDNRGNNGPPYHNPRGGYRGGYRGRGGYNRGGGFNGGNGGPPPQNSQALLPGPEPDGFGTPGCVVSLENVPFRAGIDEILEFFGDYNISKENVIRRYNEMGHPTGDARVAFSSPEEAQQALDSKLAWGINCKIRDRRIYLKIT